VPLSSGVDAMWHCDKKTHQGNSLRVFLKSPLVSLLRRQSPGWRGILGEFLGIFLGSVLSRLPFSLPPNPGFLPSLPSPALSTATPPDPIASFHHPAPSLCCFPSYSLALTFFVSWPFTSHDDLVRFRSSLEI